MPNYSPARKVFSSTKKDINEIPFDQAFLAWKTARNELTEDLQADIDEQYEAEIAEMERNYSGTHEAPYEGNFRDQLSKRTAVVTVDVLSKHTTERMKVDFIAKYGIPLHIDWILDQAVTLIGNMPVTRNENGLISGTRFKNDNFTTPWLRGLFLFLMINTKSSYLKLQYKAPHKQFGALVPFIMYAQRLVKNTKYSEWDPAEIDDVVHSDLVDAMTYSGYNFTKEQLLEYRTKGLTIKSGATEGQMKNPVSTHKLNSSDDVDWNQIPPLVQVMLTQIWMAHPENRTKYMILDPLNWDKMPASLVDREVLVTAAALPKSKSRVAVASSW